MSTAAEAQAQATIAAISAEWMPDVSEAYKPNPGKARKKAIAKLNDLLASDPEFAGLSMNTEGLHFYVPPPRAYYLGQVAIVAGFLQQPDTLSRSSAEIRQTLQDKVSGTDYSVGKNCCNKPMAQWQLDKIEEAYRSASIPLDTARYNSIAKIQRYTVAHQAGLAGATPFRIDGAFLEDGGIVVQDRRFSVFKTSTGYDTFKKDGKQFTLLSVKALAAR